MIVLFILGLVFLANYVLIREGIRSRGSSNPMARKSIRELLNPWEEESQDLDELRERISELEEPPSGQENDGQDFNAT